MSAPRLEVRLDLIEHNARSLVERLASRGIGVTGVTKSMLGSPALASTMLSAGVDGLADSRLDNIERMRTAGVRAPITLLRTPMLSQAARVVELCDTSCNTEPALLSALSTAAVSLDVVHEVLLMVELGDLREGVMPDDLVGVAKLTQDLANLRLVGLGANLACRSGVVPGAANMAELSTLAAMVEQATGEPLRVVSGGNSANLGWALGPDTIGRVNDLRLGEAVLLGLDPVERRPIEGLRGDAVTLHAEVIESGSKPSLPWGTMGQTAFGERPLVVDRGAVVQTIVALGRQDTDTTDLHEPPGMAIVASSSDHLITWTDQRIAPGTEVVFSPGYAAVLRSFSSRSVEVLHRSDSPTPG